MHYYLLHNCGFVGFLSKSGEVRLTAGRCAVHEGILKLKQLLAKLALLTVLGLSLGLAQGRAAARTYKPDYVAGFPTGLLHGMLMPAALPGLLLRRPLPIYATNNSGNTYEIGYIFGINTCGFIFFGAAFWKRQKKPPAATPEQP